MNDTVIAITTLSHIVHSNLLIDSLGYNIVSPSKDNLLCPFHTGLRDILTMFHELFTNMTYVFQYTEYILKYLLTC